MSALHALQMPVIRVSAFSLSGPPQRLYDSSAAARKLAALDEARRHVALSVARAAAAAKLRTAEAQRRADERNAAFARRRAAGRAARPSWFRRAFSF